MSTLTGFQTPVIGHATAGECIFSYIDQVDTMADVAKSHYQRLVGDGRRILQVLPHNGLVLWSKGNLVGVSSLESEASLLSEEVVTSASISREDDGLHVLIVVHSNRVLYFRLDASTLQPIAMFTSSFSARQAVTQVIKVPGYMAVVCNHPSSSSGSKVLSVVKCVEHQWDIHAEITVAIDASFTHLNLAAPESVAVVASFYQSERTNELNIVTMDIAKVLSIVKPSVIPLKLESDFLQVPMKHALAACVFDSQLGCTVYTIPNSTVEHRLTMEQLSFGLHAFNKALHGKVARYGIQHKTTFDQIGRWLEEVGSLAYTSPLTAMGLLSRSIHDVNAVVEVTPLSSTGQRVGETTVEEQAASSLLFTVASETLTLWEAVQLAQVHLVTRHALLAPSHSNNNLNNSNSSNSTGDLSSARYRQRLVMDAAMATHRTTTLLTAVTQRQPGANPVVGLSYVPYAVENIQHVFEWALGEDARSVQSTLTAQLQTLITNDVPTLLLQTPSKAVLFAQHETSRLVHVAHTFGQTMTMAQTLESVTETLFRRKLETLSEEQLLRGEARHAQQTVMLARDLASQSVAQLLCYRRLTQFQSRYVACWQWLWQHPLFDLHGYAIDQDNDGGILSRWQAVLPAIDERILPPVLTAKPELVYHRLCHDLLLPVSPADALASSAAPSSSSSSLAATPQPAFTEKLHATLLSLVNSANGHDLGTALWIPMQWFHTKIQYLLAEQLYAGHSMQDLDELLDADMRRLRRVLLYLILVAFVSAYKRAATVAVGCGGQRSSSLFDIDFVRQLHSVFYMEEAVSAFHVEEVQLLVALVLIDVDDVSTTTTAAAAAAATMTEAEAIVGNETHWVHAWRWVTRRQESPDLYLTQLPPLRQYPALRYLLEHVRFTRDEGNDSTRLPWSLTETSTEAQRRRWNDELALSSLLFAVVRRWICRGHYHAAYSLQSIAPYPRHIYLGVMAWIASIPEDHAPTLLISAMPMDDHDTLMATHWWRRLWNEAHVKVEAMPTASESLRTLQDMTQFLCRWTIAHGCFADLLNDDTLQNELAEMDAVVQYLMERADVEVQSAVCPSPAVDTLVGFLILHRRVEEARYWHDCHESRVGATRYEVDLDAKRVVDERATIIAAAEAQLWTVPRVDYDLSRNMRRCHKILAQLAEIERVAVPSTVGYSHNRSGVASSSSSTAMDTSTTTLTTSTALVLSSTGSSSGTVGNSSSNTNGPTIGGLFSTIRRPAALVPVSSPFATPVQPRTNNLFGRFSSA